MKVRYILCIILLLFSINGIKAQEPDWFTKMKQIKLLSDTREEIKQSLGKPKNNESEKLSWTYNLSEGNLYILYSTGVCKSQAVEGLQAIHGWKVPKWTVVEVGFEPNEILKPSRLNINFEEFTSTPVYDIPDAIEYRNDDLGIDYTVYKGKILDINFRPAKSLNHLICKESDIKKDN